MAEDTWERVRARESYYRSYIERLRAKIAAKPNHSDVPAWQHRINVAETNLAAIEAEKRRLGEGPTLH